MVDHCVRLVGHCPRRPMTNNAYPDATMGSLYGMTQPRNFDLARRMAELARAASAPRTVEAVLSDVTATATELIPGGDTAGVLLVGKGGKFESLAGTTDLP